MTCRELLNCIDLWRSFDDKYDSTEKTKLCTVKVLIFFIGTENIQKKKNSKVVLLRNYAFCVALLKT